MNLNKLLRLPRRLRMIYYKCWNRIKFHICGIRFGKGLNAYNKIYLNIHPSATVHIGDNFTFTSGAFFNPLCRNLRGGIYASPDSKLIIGDNVGISSACIWVHKSIKIGNNVNIGGDCIVLDSDCHSLDYLERRDNKIDQANKNDIEIVIEDDVLIGTRCIIMKGVTIGARSIIGAGSVVTKDIPADCIAAGNPCRVIKRNT